jgi:hypothetical protein
VAVLYHSDSFCLDRFSKRVRLVKADIENNLPIFLSSNYIIEVAVFQEISAVKLAKLFSSRDLC